MKLTFFSLASGSSGNCYYLGTSTCGILVDAGIDYRKISKILYDYNIEFSSISGVLVTHDHADHIRTIGVLGEKLHIPVYSTQKVHEGIAKCRYINEKLVTSKRIIRKEEEFHIGNFSITAFDIPHDSTDCVGYHIVFGNHRFTFASDVGHISDVVAKFIKKANHLIIEANYDEEMLKYGPYPEYLKERVAGSRSHLSNQEAAEFLATNYTPELKSIWLCHLSRDNNHPDLAYKTIDNRLFYEGVRVGKDVTLETLKRFNPSAKYEFF